MEVEDAAWLSIFMLQRALHLIGLLAAGEHCHRQNTPAWYSRVGLISLLMIIIAHCVRNHLILSSLSLLCSLRRSNQVKLCKNTLNKASPDSKSRLVMLFKVTFFLNNVTLVMSFHKHYA